MDLTQHLSISYYKNIAVINEAHNIFLVQHQTSNKIYIKKILDVYNINIYQQLSEHPIAGIPKIMDYWEKDGQLILIEEYISGTPLSELMADKLLTPEQINRYMAELCSILHTLHSQVPPMIHRDIKPSNIIITSCNHVILLDFNAAKQYSAASQTDTVLLGTQGYAAPEQYGFGSSSPQTDIYALGILLKEMVASLPVYTPQFDGIIAKCTQLIPRQRYQSVLQLMHALHPAVDVLPVPKEEKPFYKYFPPGFRTRTPWKMTVAALGYLFIFWLCLSLEVENVAGAALWFERIMLLAIMLSVVCGCFNYLDIQKFFPICKHPNRLIHYCGILLLNTLMVSVMFVVLIIIESVFFHV